MGERLVGKDGYLYIGALGALESGAASTAVVGWYKIASVASSSSGFGETAEVGDVIYASPAISMVSGDSAYPITLTKLAFVTNVPKSASKEKFENTVQTDDVKAYVESSKSEMSGTVEGYFIESDTTVDAILNRFFRVVTDNGSGTRTYSGTSVGVLHFFMTRFETSTAGEVHKTEYMPSIVDSLTADKPMDGPQTFSFGYTVDGAEKPCIYNRTIAA